MRGSALVLAWLCGAFAAPAYAQGADCDLSCPIGQRCDADGRCVRSQIEAAAPFHESPAGGLPEANEPTAYRHDGLMLRLGVGLGAGFAREETSAPAVSVDLEPGRAVGRIDFSGVAIARALDVGVALDDRFTVFLRFGDLTLPKPGHEASGDSPPRVGESTRSALLTAAGVAWFIMPQNVHIGLSAGPLLWRGARFDADSRLGDLGIGANLDLGIEWWLDTQWGLGIAARLCALWAGGDAQPRGERAIQAIAPSLVASMTYQ